METGNNLVERLRDLRDDYAAGKWRQADTTQGLLSLAADHIEQLEATLKLCNEAAGEWTDEVEMLVAEHKALRGALSDLVHLYFSDKADIDLEPLMKKAKSLVE